MSDRDLLAAYLATTWTVRAPGGTLRVRPGEPAPAALRPSAIVTAWNPASRRLSRAENHAADEGLRARIAAAGAPAWPTLARGAGEDGGAWDEAGWCLPGEVRELAVALGAAFGQNAIVCIGGDGAVTMVCTRDGFCGRRIGETVNAAVPSSDVGS